MQSKKSNFILSNINKSFDGIHAVNGFDFEWKDQKIIGLIGPNGAGKTTLFNVTTGFLQADSGSFFLNGKNIINLPPYRIVKQGISRTFQDLRLLRQITVKENILLWRLNQVGENPLHAWIRGRKYSKNQTENSAKAEEILEFIGLKDKQNDLAEALSYGQQKLLSLGCALATEAEYLLLDEPVAGINPAMIEKILGLLEQLSAQGKKILLIEHNIDVIRQICDWLIVMDEGRKIAEGVPDEVLQREEIIEAYLD